MKLFLARVLLNGVRFRLMIQHVLMYNRKLDLIPAFLVSVQRWLSGCGGPPESYSPSGAGGPSSSRHARPGALDGSVRRSACPARSAAVVLALALVAWFDGANADAPTASNDAVTTPEDTAYTFTTADFNYFEADSHIPYHDAEGDIFPHVKIVTLPAADKGDLKLNNVNVSVNAIVTETELGNGNLTYSPPANANGTPYASFTFKVNDGINDSLLSYTMSVNVTAVNDRPTGRPTVIGAAQVGQTLTADTSDIADVDGLNGVSYSYQWIQVDGATDTDISGETSSSYVPAGADVDKRIKVEVKFLDNGKTSETLTSALTAPVLTPMLRVSGGSTVTEGETATFTLFALPMPTRDITVTVMVTDSGAFAVSGQTGTKTVTIGTGGTGTLAVTTVDDTTDEPNGAITATVTGGSGYRVHDSINSAPMTINDNARHSASVTVNDDDATALTLAGSTGNVTEGDTKEFTVSLDRGLVNGESLVAPLTFTGTATRGTDYTLVCASASGVVCAGLNSGSATVTFTGPNSGTTATLMTIALTATADFVAETTAETVSIGLDTLVTTGLDGGVTTTDNLADFSIVDPLASFDRVSQNAPENGGTHNVTVNLNPPPQSAITLSYTVGGTATAGSGNDFTIASSGTVAVSSGANNVNIPVAVRDDRVDENDETVILTLTQGAGYTLGSAAVHTLTIKDDDTRGVTVSETDLSIAEGDTGTYTVVLTSAPTSEVTITPSSDNPDVTLSDELTFTRNNWNQPQTVTVRGAEDPDAANESATIMYTVTGGDYGSGGVTTADVVVAVTDNDLASTGVALTVMPNPVGESAGDTTVTVTATLNGGTRGDAVQLTVTVGSGTATAGVDFTKVSDVSLMIDRGERSGKTTFVLTPTADETDEADETVAVNATTPAKGLSVSGTDLTITDDDAAPRVRLALSPTMVDEAGWLTRVRATLDRASSEETTVTVSASPGSGAVEGDYRLSRNTTLTIAAGTRSSTGVVTLTVMDNQVDTANKIVTVSATVANSQGAVAPVDALLTVTDDDVRGVTVTKTTLDIDEGDTGTYTVVLTSAPTGEVTIMPSSDNPDVTLSGALTFTRANWDSAKTVTVTAAGDEDAANDRAMITHAVTGYSGVTAAEVAVTINDNDATVVTLTGPKGDVTEGDTKAFTVNLSRALVDGESLVAPLTLTGSATRGTDYTLACASATGVACAGLNSGTATVTFAGSSSATTATSMTITLTAAPDTTAEPAETVSIGLDTLVTTGLDGGVTTTDNLADFSIVDPLASFDRVSQNAPENGGTHNVTVNLNPPPQSNITLNYTVGGTATAGSGNDFTIASSGTVAVSSGANNVNIPVAVRDDRVDENDETVILTLTQGAGYTVGTAAVHTLTIKDDDTRGVTVSETDLSIAEGDTGTYTVVLTSAPTSEVTITPSSDNPDVTVSDELTFTRNNWNQPQTVTVRGAEDPDAANESATIMYTVTGGDYGSGGVTTADVVVAVTDNDLASTGVALTVMPNPVGESAGDTTVTVTATLNGGTRGDAVQLTVTVGSGTATAGVDFTKVSDVSLMIDRGERSGKTTFVLTPTADETDEADETVAVNATTPAKGLSVSGTDLTITDDDAAPRVRLALSPTMVNEAGWLTRVRATLDRASSEETTVTVSASPGSGAVEGDYRLSRNTTLTIAAGTRSSTGVVTLTVMDNQVDTANKIVTVSATVANSQGAVAPVDALLTVTDDDVRGVTVTKTTLDIDEGDTGTYTVVLTSAPTGEVTIMPSSDNPDVTLSGALTFTRANWDSAKTVTVTTAGDEDAANDRAMITHAVTGYSGVTAAEVAVTINDNDATVVTLTGPKGDVTEGDTKAFTVNLSRALVDGESLVAPLTLTGSATRGTDYTLACASATGVACAGLNSGTATVTFTGSSSATTATSMTITLTAAPDTTAEPAETVVIGLGTPTPTSLDGGATTTDTLADFSIVDPTPVADFDLDLHSASEDAGTRNVTVNLSPAAPHAGITLTYSVGGTATAGSGNDFTIADSGSVTLLSGATGVNIPVLIADDNADESAETVILALTQGAGYTVGTAAVHTLTIKDDDTRGVTVSETDLSIAEGDTGTYTVVLTSAPTSEVTITPSSDNPDVTVSDELTFTRNNWNQPQTVTVRGAEDPDAANESATIMYTVTGGDYGSGGVTTADVVVAVTDNDLASTGVALTVMPNPVGESAGDTTVTVTATLNGGTRGDAVQLTVTVGSGTATAGVDFTKVSDVSLMIDRGERSGKTTFVLTPTADETDEADETVAVNATTPAKGLSVSGTDLTITDDDAAPRVRLALSPTMVNEAGWLTRVRATLDRASSKETTVTVSASPGSGAVEGDYRLSRNTTLTIAAGTRSSTGVVTLTVMDNQVDTANKIVTVSATVANSQGAVAPVDALLTVTDDDVRGVTVTKTTLDIDEGDTGTYTVVLTSAPTGEVTIMPSSDNPDVTLSGALTFTRANWDSAKTVTVTAAGDEDAANDRAMITHAVTGYSGVTAAEVAVTINDNDATVVTLTGPKGDVTEGDTKAFTVNLSRALVDGESLVAPLTLTGSATRGTDYTLDCASATGVACAGLNSGSATVTFTGPNSGKTATSMTITLTALADNAAETAETVVIGLGTPTATSLDGGATTTDTLADFSIVDPTPVADFNLALHSASEDAGTRNVTVNLSPAVPHAGITLTYSVGGTATARNGNDFTIADSGSVTLLSGATSVNIPVLIADDNADESAETVLLTLTAGNGYTVGAKSVHTLTINDNDATAVTLTGPADDVTEGDTKAFTVNLSRALVDGESLVAPLTLTGTATRGTDYTLDCASATGVVCAGLNSGSATVTFTGSSSPTTATSMTITLAAAPDTTAETAETVVIGLGTPTATSLDGGTTTTATLADFSIVDPTPVADFNLALHSASEDAGTHNVTVNLSPAAPHAGITLTYNVGGTATAGGGNNFTIADSGSVTLLSGATSVNIPVLIADDNADESAETVLLTLTAGNGYTVGAISVHTLTINDNDATAVTLTGPADDVTEGDTKAFTVNLSRALVDGESLVAPLTLTGTATRGTDYTLDCASATGVVCAGLNSGSATVTFTGSSSPTTATSMTITLAAAPDTTAEPAETVVIGLGTPTATSLDGGATTTATLADFSIVDPTPVADFNLALHSASEDAGTRNVTVNLSPAVPHAGITLTYSVGGTATAGNGNDFTIADSGSVTLLSGATSVNIPVLIADDNADESAETVLLTLTAGNGYTVGAISVHTLTINDNDATAVTLTGPADDVTEGDTKAFTVNLSRALVDGESLVAPLTLTGSATRGTDYTLDCTSATGVVCAGLNSGSATVTFTGSSSPTTATSMTITLTAAADTTAEPTAETVVIGLGTPMATGLDGGVTKTDNLADFSIVDPLALIVTRSVRVAENESAVLTVTAVGSEAQDGAVRYSLSGGADQSWFTIDRETGALSFVWLPDYEYPDDTGGNNEYIVTVGATSGAGERSAEQTITVTVTDVYEIFLEPGTPVREAGLYQQERTTITVTNTASTAASVTLPYPILDASGAPLRRLNIKIVGALSAPLPDRTEFGFGFDPASRVNINVSPVPKGGVELCLPVSGELRLAAGGQPLHARDFTSGTWRALPSADKGDQVCAAGVSTFSPFMASFRAEAASMGRALPAWLARFGRAVTDPVLDAVADRLAAPRSPGMKVSLAGRALPTRGQDKAVREDRPAGNAAGSLRASLAERGAMDALRNWISHTGAEGDDLPHGAPGAGSRALQSWSPTGRELRSDTSFALTGEPRADGALLSVWGRGAMTNFDARDGGLALDGEAQTLLVGAERSWRGWTTGGILGRSRAEGGYRSAAETGEIESTLTGVYPWVGRAVNDQVSAWATLGYGAGDLTFQPEDGAPVRTALSLALGAVGLRGEVLRPLEAGGLSLAVKGDVRFTRVASKAAGDTMVGRLMAAEADVWRVRAGVEGARSFMANDDAWATITPSFEVGVRLDGGDAETGFGADVGGGVALVDPGRGVTLEMKARALAAHEAEGFREWGASAALAWEPRPQRGRGLSLSLTQSWGASSSGGMDALLSRDTLVGLAASDTAPAGRRLEAELGYGMTVFGGDFTATPNAGLTLTEGGRDWRLGWRLTPAWPDGSGFEVNLDATRIETDDETPVHALMLRGALRF